MGDNIMESRGQKRSEIGDGLPADKRACSSLEFRPSSSSASPQKLVRSSNSALETHEGDMETSSSSASVSASGRSEGDGERDSPYGSCDSDDMNDGDHRYSGLREFQRSRSYGDNSKFTGLLSSLSNEAETSGQLTALTELCELLSFCTEDSISNTLADQLAPVLVQLAKHENNPDIMLLAIRALTYLCDVFPRSSSFLVKHEAVAALCQRLMVIEYLDVAEQCLQALEKISRDQPHACLQAGAIMAVLGYIDFFSTTVQRTALSVVGNICKKLPSEHHSIFMEAVPRLCDLLQYEDQQLVELVVMCLIRIVERVKDSPEMLSQLYGYGLIHQAIHLIDLHSRVTLNQSTYTGLIGLVAKLASGSADAVGTLFELDIGSILKDVLSNTDLSHGMPPPRGVDKNCNQDHEILKLLHQLLPEAAPDQNEELLSCKERILLDHPDRLQKLGMDILPTLVQVVNSGASLYVCYGCLSVINRLVYYNKPNALHGLIKDIGVASFLAGVFTRNDHHILLLALQIAQTVLEKLSNVLMKPFIKEGVLFAIDALLMPDNCSQFTFPSSNGLQRKNSVGREVMRCLCYAFDTRQSGSTSDSRTCKVDKNSIHNLAEHIKMKYFPAELNSSQSLVTDVLQDLRKASMAIADLLKSCSSEGALDDQKEEELSNKMHEVILQLCGNEPISTFELIESGIIKALLNYLTNGRYLSDSCALDGRPHGYAVQKRFETFARISLSSADPVSNDLPLSLLVRKLQCALSTVEMFPVVGGYAPRQRGSYAAVPHGRCTMYPCLRVRFVREEEETCLGDYCADAMTVDPFCLVGEIERCLRPKVSQKKVEPSEASGQASDQGKSIPIQVSVDAASLLGKSMELEGSESMCTISPNLQEDMEGRSSCSPMETSYLGQTRGSQPKAVGEVQSGSFDEEIHSSSVDSNLSAGRSACTSGDQEESKKGLCRASCSSEDVPSKLTLYLEGQQLDYSSTLYQEIILRRMRSHSELQNTANLWSETYAVTYKGVTTTETSCHQEYTNLHDGDSSDKMVLGRQVMPSISGMFVQKLGSTLDLSSPTGDVLYLIRNLEIMNRLTHHLVSYERMNAFAEGKIDNLDNLKVTIPKLSQYQFVNSKLTEKLEQQMRETTAIHVGALPLWCTQLMMWCPFLFSFEARWKYFQLAAFGRSHVLPNLSSFSDIDVSRERRSNAGSLPRKKFMASRDNILESAAQMMDLYASKKVVIEVEYSEEVGTGLGPTLEFYTLVSHEFQKAGLGMWRGDYVSSHDGWDQQHSSSGYMLSTTGLFPRPWSPISGNIDRLEFVDVLKKFDLLGRIVGKAVQDGRVLDIPFSKAFYKLVLGKELSLCDIQSFDPELGRILLEFQAFVKRQKYVELACNKDIDSTMSSGFQNTKVEELCLDFSLPGYPDYILSSKNDNLMVNDNNFEEYISLVVDATLHTGISRQLEAFKSGLNQVISDRHLHVFTEEELERLLCGESDCWLTCDLLDHIKFDHGYTASSTPIINLLDVLSEFDHEQRRAFLQFVTGAPRLPPGGLAALNPKLTIVRKQSSGGADADLPSVMTCANYLKLPPYSTKERLKEKLLFAITEGQGSFHLS